MVFTYLEIFYVKYLSLYQTLSKATESNVTETIEVKMQVLCSNKKIPKKTKEILLIFNFWNFY